MLLINDLNAHTERYRADLDAAFTAVADSGWLVLGPHVTAFEEAFARFLGVDHVVGVANGTDALELCLRSLGVGPGDAVLTAANAGFYSSTAILATGAKPVFCEVDLERGLVQPETVEAAILQAANKPKAAILTHLFGWAVPEVEQIVSSCHEQGIAVVEDCAQAHGAMQGGKRVGSFGDVAAFSFYPTKNLGALGDGGAIATKSAHLATRVKELRQYGWTAKYQVGVRGGKNSRLDELQAAFLQVFLPHLDESNAERRNVAAQYDAEIINEYVHTRGVGKEDDVAHLYVVRTDDRDSLRAHLQARGIGSDVHYPIADYQQPSMVEEYRGISLPHTEQRCATSLTLPCYPEITEQQRDLVIRAVNEWKP